MRLHGRQKIDQSKTRGPIRNRFLLTEADFAAVEKLCAHFRQRYRWWAVRFALEAEYLRCQDRHTARQAAVVARLSKTLGNHRGKRKFMNCKMRADDWRWHTEIAEALELPTCSDAVRLSIRVEAVLLGLMKPEEFEA